MPQCAACRNDANDVGTRGATRSVCDHEDEVSTGAADRLPTLLAALDAVLEHESERVVEDARRVIKTDAMFGEITSCLRRVPLEREHVWHVTTTPYVQASRCYGASGASSSSNRIASSSVDEPLCGGADTLERSVQRVGRAAVAPDVLDGGLGAGDAELGAEQLGDRFGFGLARGEVGACGAVGREVQQHVRRLVGERRELDVGGLAETHR